MSILTGIDQRTLKRRRIGRGHLNNQYKMCEAYRQRINMLTCRAEDNSDLYYELVMLCFDQELFGAYLVNVETYSDSRLTTSRALS